MSFLDGETEQPLGQEWVALAKKQGGDAIKKAVSDQVDKMNASIEALGTLHCYTPPPERPKYQKAPFELPSPVRPDPRPLGLIAKIIKSKREEIEAENASAAASWREEMARWDALKASHEAREERRRQRAEEEILTDIVAMEAQLEENLADIEWPRETAVNFEIRAGGALCVLDVDLPEIEHMPEFEAAVTGRGFEIKKKELSDTKRRKLYMQHIHSLALRIVGEAFATLPGCEKVVLSGYSQRPDPRTGQTRDEYLLSLGVDRSAWRSIDFTALSAVDPVAAVDRFELRRAMSKTGVFAGIEPLI